MKEKFLKAVENADIITVRLFIANELMLDPRGKSYNEMKKYAESKFTDLYEVSDGREYSVQSFDWDEDFLVSLKNDLDLNFSKERLSLFESVAKTVLKDKARLLDEKESSSVTETSRRTSSSNHRQSSSQTSNKPLYAGLTIGGAAVAVAGLCIEKAVLSYMITGLGVIGLAIGGTLLYKESKK